jgi:hypothetical protein
MRFTGRIIPKNRRYTMAQLSCLAWITGGLEEVACLKAIKKSVFDGMELAHWLRSFEMIKPF